MKQLWRGQGLRGNIAASALVPGFSRDYWWNASAGGDGPDALALGAAGAGGRIPGGHRHADISASIKITDFETGHPERQNRVFSVGIAEQNDVGGRRPG